MKLGKVDREQIRLKYDGRCAYCGEPLGERWHADHIEPVERKLEFVGGKLVTTGEAWQPERHRLDNINPACAPCNLDKHAMNLEGWRYKLERAVEVLTRNNPTYRHAVRFGLVRETAAPVTFYFESAGNGGVR